MNAPLPSPGHWSNARRTAATSRAAHGLPQSEPAPCQPTWPLAVVPAPRRVATASPAAKRATAVCGGIWQDRALDYGVGQRAAAWWLPRPHRDRHRAKPRFGGGHLKSNRLCPWRPCVGGGGCDGWGSHRCCVPRCVAQPVMTGAAASTCTRSTCRSSVATNSASASARHHCHRSGAGNVRTTTLSADDHGHNQQSMCSGAHAAPVARPPTRPTRACTGTRRR